MAGTAERGSPVSHVHSEPVPPRPQGARLVRALGRVAKVATHTGIKIEGWCEMTAVDRRRSLLLVGAILTVCLSFGFSFTDGGAVWFWTEVPWFGGVLVLLGAVLTGVYLVLRRRSKRRLS